MFIMKSNVHLHYRRRQPSAGNPSVWTTNNGLKTCDITLTQFSPSSAELSCRAIDDGMMDEPNRAN